MSTFEASMCCPLDPSILNTSIIFGIFLQEDKSQIIQQTNCGFQIFEQHQHGSLSTNHRHPTRTLSKTINTSFSVKTSHTIRFSCFYFNAKINMGGSKIQNKLCTVQAQRYLELIYQAMCVMLYSLFIGSFSTGFLKARSGR